MLEQLPKGKSKMVKPSMVILMLLWPSPVAVLFGMIATGKLYSIIQELKIWTANKKQKGGDK